MASHTSSGFFDYDEAIFNSVSSTDMPFDDDFIISIVTNDIFLKNFKVYKYAFNRQSVIEDLGAYNDPDENNYNYYMASYFYSYYYYKFTTSNYSKYLYLFALH